MPDAKITKLLERFVQRDRVALARVITLVENRSAEVTEVMEQIYSRLGNAYIIGVTGAPGAGKSTLVNRLIAKYRAKDKLVAVLAIDPSSPFSGGAVLGDRVRMTDHYRDGGVYIRSLSTRGHHGGLSRAAREIVKLLDAFGHDIIMIETVGVGQTELSVMDLADTIVVVTVPEGGDGVQVMKAGLNEIADLFVVNKADRDGADRIKAELEMNVHLRPAEGWRPPVLLTQASEDVGLDTLVEAIERHGDYTREHHDADRDANRRAREFAEVLTTELEERAERSLRNGGGGENVRGMVERVREGNLNPYSATRQIINNPAAVAELLRNDGASKRERE
ncbi:MAG TPA: methylmalonyl Co-A mutase-associated GTPase MeaB [Candidatus Binataceae bacterium]|nr:methylmalonyl Co-A mutase-associated GTPase MeaB [Candidatus Binataceae bacterium]